MVITPIGREAAFQVIPRERSLSGQAPPLPGEQGKDGVVLDVAIPEGDAGAVYDRAGNLRRGVKASEDEPAADGKYLPAHEEEELTEEEKREVAELRHIDRTVRAHEMAHMAAGAGLVRGGPNYQYERGPDGNMYAVGGEVSIDTSEEKTPEQTVQKMRRVRAAALAPADPSSQDRSVAAAAAQKAQEAAAEIAQEAVSAGASDTGQPSSEDSPADPAKGPRGYEGVLVPGRAKNTFDTFA